MATTIYSSFEKLKSNLEITSLQGTTVSSRQKRVKEAVEKDFSVVNSFLTGSYKRHTLISPLSDADIDIFIVLYPEYYDYGPQKLLDLVKDTLKKKYPKTPEISRNGQAVTIYFKDFNVDVIPGFKRSEGGYLIPTTAGKWLVTNPKSHIEIFSKANTDHNKKLIPLIKMIKSWNKKIGNYFQSFSLEVLALNILNGVHIDNYPTAMNYFFYHGQTRIKQIISDPAGYSGDIGEYLNNKVDEAENKFKTAYNRTYKAINFENNGEIINAVNEWKKIFGSDFPAYG